LACWRRSSTQSLFGDARRSKRAGGVLRWGAGRGSMAVWLAERVGPSGRVVATDIDVTYLERLDVPNLEVHRHNILVDPLDPLEAGSFDAVCSRLMLFHLVGRQEEAIRRMVLCLRPGGLLIDEDADWGTTAPVDRSHPVFAAFHRAWRDGDWWATRGYDPTFGRSLPVLFERSGLESIEHEASSEVVRGGSPWARWYRESLNVIADATGAQTAEQTEEHEIITTALGDPSISIDLVPQGTLARVLGPAACLILRKFQLEGPRGDLTLWPLCQLSIGSRRLRRTRGNGAARRAQTPVSRLEDGRKFPSTSGCGPRVDGAAFGCSASAAGSDRSVQ